MTAVIAECPLPTTTTCRPANAANAAGVGGRYVRTPVRGGRPLADRRQAVRTSRARLPPGAGGVDHRPGIQPELLPISHRHGP